MNVLSTGVDSIAQLVHAQHQLGLVEIEHERLCAICRQAVHRFCGIGDLEDYAEVRKVRRCLACWGWQTFCESLSPFTLHAVIWQILKGIQSPVQQLHPFGALAMCLKCSKLAAGKAFLNPVARPSTAVAMDIYQHPKGDFADAPADVLYVPVSANFPVEELSTTMPCYHHHFVLGPDGLPYHALDSLGSAGLDILLKLVNSSCGKVPEPYKESQLKPRKSLRALDSFRPIVLTSCISKIMERLILARLLWFLEPHCLLLHVISRFWVALRTVLLTLSPL